MALPLVRATALAQGLYYALTGFWPVVNMPTFELFTGKKKEHWLVKTVGLLIGVIGLSLASAARRGRSAEPDIVALGTGSALSLAAVDIVYWKRDTLPPVYLLDAAAELILVAAWIFGTVRDRSRSVP